MEKKQVDQSQDRQLDVNWNLFDEAKVTDEAIKKKERKHWRSMFDQKVHSLTLKVEWQAKKV